MFHFLPMTKVISMIAGIYALLFLTLYLILAKFGIEIRLLLAFSGAAVVDLALIGFAYAGWRRLWAAIPRLNRWFYPDLNGHWLATIDWVHDLRSGSATGTVHIKQDFFKISIEMDAERSESRTIALCAKKDPESGRPFLHYIYEVSEKHTSEAQNGIYRGAASLGIDALSANRLSGNYFTSRGTGGRFLFTRVF